ncbi:hypothetical protein AS026_17280 [Rhizobium altiplani]|uniref:DUF1737 domain-containing protein n=1 Tax=Rhizobium altiplani TaxID=1864509 RepID=A0A109J891_9HYPH|nr:DUF1737 domain-containing protein [Rhizobium altiplani]KWV44129.1 hypothetical protein AS026_17280 [Rhizobium altiplani]
MKLYRLLTGQDDAAFCHRVTDALNKGWSLNGSPSLTFNTLTGQVMCAQAIVKEVEGKDYHPDMKLSEQ